MTNKADPYPRLASWAEERRVWAKHPLPWTVGCAYNMSAAILDAEGDVVIDTYVDATVSMTPELKGFLDMIVERNNNLGAEMAKQPQDES